MLSNLVTLYARVWIEMRMKSVIFSVFHVTLYARVWIEITKAVAGAG